MFSIEFLCLEQTVYKKANEFFHGHNHVHLKEANII